MTRVLQTNSDGEQSPSPTEFLKIIWARDAEPVLNGQFVVKSLLHSGSLVMVFGDSNSGKTFFAIDMALAIAGGKRWRDLKVSPGMVIYIAGEGTDGIKNRVAASQAAGLSATGIPLGITNRAADLLHLGGDMDGLLALIKHAESESGEKCVLIVVDTLARAMAGGDENSGEDMGVLISNADRLRKQTGACVMLIHHCGKDASKGARGHSSLRGAVDTEILIDGRSGMHTATVTKQRDLPGGQVFGFELEQQLLGHDEDGDPVTSCIVRHLGDSPGRKHRPRAPQQRALLDAMQSRQREAVNPIMWDAGGVTALCQDIGINHRNSRRAALRGLLDAGFLQSNGGCWTVSETCT